MAWKRVIQMIIQNSSSAFIISDLNLTFNIERSTELSANSAQFTIYNAKEETRKKILNTGSTVIFKAGHEDEKNIGIIFSGTITKSISKKEGTEWITEIECQDIASNRSGLNYSTVELSYKEKTPLSSIVSDIAGILSIPVAGLENTTRILNNGFVFSGSKNNLLIRINNMLAEENAALYFDNSEMVLFKKGTQNSKFGIVRITPRSGLIGEVAEINSENDQDNKKRIGFQSILNPKIKPNCVVNVVTAKVNGSFAVEKVSHKGDNFSGGEFISEVEARR